MGRRVRGTTGTEREVAHGRPPKKHRIYGWMLILTIVVVGSAVILGPWAVINYDKSHRVSIECTVTGAEGGRSSASARGSASWSQVSISTSDCGPLLLSSGINESNRDAVAAQLNGGGSFSFEIGVATQSLRWLTDPIGLTPMVWAFEKTN